MNKPLDKIVKQRFSCRTYLDTPIEENHQRLLTEFLDTCQKGPLGTQARFELLAATEADRSSLKGLGTYGFVN